MTFDQAFEDIIFFEGGYVNDPRDPGGETKYGISKRSFPEVNIKELTLDQAKEIYKKNYWEQTRCDDLPSYLRLPVFDCAVNQGTISAIILLQRCSGVPVDGILGSKTLEGIRGQNSFNLLTRFTVKRLMKYTTTNNFKIYGHSWISRTIVSSMKYLIEKRGL